jgi:hypothetical protein
MTIDGPGDDADQAAIDPEASDQQAGERATDPTDAVEGFLARATEQGLLDPLHAPADEEALQAAAEALEAARSASAAALAAAGAAERAAESLRRFTLVRTTEEEIGDLLVRSQRFIENAIADAEHQARQIVAAARTQADAMLADATTRTSEPQSRAPFDPTNPPFSSPPVGPAPVLTAQSAQELNSTIDGYIKVNTELMHELRLLSGSLGTPEPAQNEGNAISS